MLVPACLLYVLQPRYVLSSVMCIWILFDNEHIILQQNFLIHYKQLELYKLLSTVILWVLGFFLKISGF